MKDIIKKRDGAVFMVINGDGQEVRLLRDVVLSFDNISGAKIRVLTEMKSVRIHGHLPESQDRVEWHYDLENEKCGSLATPRCKLAQNLQSLVAGCRVEMNGAL